MPKENLLTDIEVNAAKPGLKDSKLIDGGGLHLLIRPNKTKLWQYRFKLGGKESTHSIGPYDKKVLPLSQARKLRDAARTLVSQGKCPNAERKREREANMLAERLKRKNSFTAVFETWMTNTSKGLSAETVRQRRLEIQRHAKPLLNKPITDITRPDIVAVLEPLEQALPETSRNVRQHINAIFETAIDDGLVAGNPSPTRRKIKRRPVRPHPALHGPKFQRFLVALAADKRAEFKCKTAMELLVLTVGRKIEVAGARWSEFDFDQGLWEVPEERMKERLPQCVPLSRQAIALLKAWKDMSPEGSAFVFPNRRSPMRPMARGSLNALMVRLGFQDEGTPHGHRSTFSTYFNRRQSNKDVIERCLAHVHGDKSRAAYNRYEYLDERRQMMQEWADYIDELRADAPLQ